MVNFIYLLPKQDYKINESWSFSPLRYSPSYGVRKIHHYQGLTQDYRIPNPVYYGERLSAL